jgi:hypothetical protein
MQIWMGKLKGGFWNKKWDSRFRDVVFLNEGVRDVLYCSG